MQQPSLLIQSTQHPFVLLRWKKTKVKNVHNVIQRPSLAFSHIVAVRIGGTMSYNLVLAVSKTDVVYSKQSETITSRGAEYSRWHVLEQVVNGGSSRPLVSVTADVRDSRWKISVSRPTISMTFNLTLRLPSTRYAELELGYKSTVIVRCSHSLCDYQSPNVDECRQHSRPPIFLPTRRFSFPVFCLSFTCCRLSLEVWAVMTLAVFPLIWIRPRRHVRDDYFSSRSEEWRRRRTVAFNAWYSYFDHRKNNVYLWVYMQIMIGWSIDCPSSAVLDDMGSSLDLRLSVCRSESLVSKLKC